MATKCALPLQTLPKSVTWLQAQRLLPLVGWSAEKTGYLLSEELNSAVKAANYLQTARHSLAHRQLQTLAGLARTLDLPVVVVKGPVVAEAYPTPELRPYKDIDLFVPETMTSAFVVELERLGYQATVIGDRSTHLPAMRPPEPGFHVEVHGLPYEGFSFLPSQPWLTYPGLCIPDCFQHFLYLVYHVVGRHELSSGLLHLVDVWFWTEAWTEEDWVHLYDLAQAFGHERMVGLVLALLPFAWTGMMSSVPPDLFPSPPHAVVEAGRRAVLGDQRSVMPHINRDLQERSVQGWVSYAKLVLLGNPYVRRDLPWSKKFLFYVRRPFRLLKNYTPLFMRLLCGDQQSRESIRRQRELRTWIQGGA